MATKRRMRIDKSISWGGIASNTIGAILIGGLILIWNTGKDVKNTLQSHSAVIEQTIPEIKKEISTVKGEITESNKKIETNSGALYNKIEESGKKTNEEIGKVNVKVEASTGELRTKIDGLVTRTEMTNFREKMGGQLDSISKEQIDVKMKLASEQAVRDAMEKLKKKDD